MERLAEKRGFICDMDGVIYHGNRLLPGVDRFVEWLLAEQKEFLFLTNASDKDPAELRNKLLRMGLDVGVEHFYTSALATAQFIASQSDNPTAYVIGAHGLTNALHDVGVVFDEIDPEFVVVGETPDFRFEHIKKAMNFVNNGARLVATNFDVTGPVEDGLQPACRALVAPIEAATGKAAYYVGKPNPLMMRTGLRMLGVHSEETCMIGDRMDTDIVAGVETGLDTVLVLSGVSSRKMVSEYAYRPTYILDGVADILREG